MLKPAIQPEEMLIGYLGRTASWNSGDAHCGSLNLQKRWAYERWGKSNCDNPIRLAVELSGLSVEQLCRKHSLMSLLWPLSALFYSDPDLGSEHRLCNAGRLLRCPLHFCPDCVVEDLDYHGFSYWRRDHQLIGAFWCLKHGSLLIPARGAPDSYWRVAPSHYLALAQPTIPDGIPHAVGQGRIKTFLELQSQILSNRIELTEAQLVSVCEERAKSLGIRLHRNGVGALFFDVLMAHFPEAWLRLVYPKYSNLPSERSVRNHYVGPTRIVFPRVERPEMKAGALLATIAALWESADEALFQLQGGGVCADPAWKNLESRLPKEQSAELTHKLQKATVQGSGSC